MFWKQKQSLHLLSPIAEKSKQNHKNKKLTYILQKLKFSILHSRFT